MALLRGLDTSLELRSMALLRGLDTSLELRSMALLRGLDTSLELLSHVLELEENVLDRGRRIRWREGRWR